jgi:hypothetical protein
MSVSGSGGVVVVVGGGGASSAIEFGAYTPATNATAHAHAAASSRRMSGVSPLLLPADRSWPQLRRLVCSVGEVSRGVAGSGDPSRNPYLA